VQLRPYQLEAVEAIYDYLRTHDDNPCAVLPTASGKTPIIATICDDAVTKWSGRVLICAHVKELLEQSIDKLNMIAPKLWNKVGIYSAGLKSRDTDQPIIVGGIQSIYKRACELGAFDLIIVDEAHLIPTDGDGMYRRFLADAKTVNPNVRVIGLTATPYRMKSGMVCGPNNVLNNVCYEIGIKELIEAGYLCQLITKGSKQELDTSSLHVRAGEFVQSEADDLMDTASLVRAACQEIVNQAAKRNSVLVFATSVKHGQHVAATLRKNHGASVECVFGDTLPFERKQILDDFKAQRIKYLVNVNVLTTGFDAPNIDCVALVRPTASPGLYYQMVGRGFRIHESKSDCLILDFGGNVLRHGPVDAITIKGTHKGNGEAPAKKCPMCLALIACGYAVCPDCGYEFPPPERQVHDSEASNAGILSEQITIDDVPVKAITYRYHTKRGAPPEHPKTMCVAYAIGLGSEVCEWVCFDHEGFARRKAEGWWRKRSNAPVPESVTEAIALADAGALCQTEAVVIRSIAGEEYSTIIGYSLGPKPPWREPGWDEPDEPESEADLLPTEVPF